MKTVRLLALLAAASVARELPLPQAHRELLKSNLDLTMARQKVGVAESRRREGLSAWHPAVKAKAAYLYQSESPATRVALPWPLDTAFEISMGDNDKTEFGIDLSYPFFTGMSRYHATRAGRLDVLASREQEKSVERVVSFQLGITYFSWELSHRMVGTQQALLEQLGEYARQTRELLEAGMSTSTRVSEAEARLAEVKVSLVTMANRADSIKLEIAHLINSIPNSGMFVNS